MFQYSNMFEYLKIFKSHVTATYQFEDFYKISNFFVIFHSANKVKYLKKNTSLLIFFSYKGLQT